MKEISSTLQELLQLIDRQMSGAVHSLGPT
jgi:hypothetical protein